jgi:hypothetical protein
MSVLKLSPKNRNPLYCSFCGKEKDEVVYLVAGSTVFICNECVELCREIGTRTLVMNVLENLPNVTEAEGRAMATGEATPDATDDICQCVTCGRMHRRLGTPPPSVMEQIARDMREGTFPKKSEQTQREDAASAAQAEPQPGTQPPPYNPDDWGDDPSAAVNALENLPTITEAAGRAMATGEATPTQSPKK